MTAALLVGAGVALAGCTVPQDTDTLQSRGEGTTGTQEAADLEIERAETRMELIALRDRIDARINNVDRHMEMVDQPADRQRDLQNYRQELVQNKQRVEQELQAVEEARPGAWRTVRTTAASTVHEVEDWFLRQGERIEGWFQDDDTTQPDNDVQDGTGTGTQQNISPGTGTHGTGTQGTGTTGTGTGTGPQQGVGTDTGTQQGGMGTGVDD